ncbi:unnamed protein product [Closterium sp. Naga37s-1]|nr:unnamed protein product [Closterium sp. Naga37s-1]
MTVERVCSEVLMEEQTLSIEQSYKQITNDASAFSGVVNTIVATPGVNGKEWNGGREQMDKKKDGKREKKRAPFKGRCYSCNEEGHMAAKCPNKKKDATPAAVANVAEGDGKGMKANLVSPGQLTDKGANVQIEEGVTHIIALGVQVVATARYRHRLLCVDLKPWPASNGTAAAVACNGTAAAPTCNGTAAVESRKGTTAAATCNGTAAAEACKGMAATAACNGTVAAAACSGMVAATASNGTVKVLADVALGKPEVKKGVASLRRTRWAPRQRPTYGTLALDTSTSMR